VASIVVESRGGWWIVSRDGEQIASHSGLRDARQAAREAAADTDGPVEITVDYPVVGMTTMLSL